MDFERRILSDVFEFRATYVYINRMSYRFPTAILNRQNKYCTHKNYFCKALRKKQDAVIIKCVTLKNYFTTMRRLRNLIAPTE